MQAPVVTIRSATSTDAHHIAEIYDHYVLNTVVSFEEEAVSQCLVSVALVFMRSLLAKKVAHFEQVGYKQDRWVAVAYWPLMFQ